MTFGFTDLQFLINDWQTATVPETGFGNAILERICQVLRTAQANPTTTTWYADLQPLIRHCLLYENDHKGSDVSLRVPAAHPWPTRADWERHSVEVIPAGNDAYILSAQAWYPEWLGTATDGVFHDAFTDRIVRTAGSCEADPFISDATGFSTYSSPGQREAVRAVFLMRADETLLVNLPTGSGKSLVGQAPALVHKLEGSLTIFVVPTVALAIDQERAMADYIRRTDQVASVWPLAWYGGLTKEKRAEIRMRLRNGTQRILFTSPEALTTTLLGAVTEAANAGMLQYLVIDEAHLITQWGDAFRPSFQALAGLRNNLLRSSPSGFRTVLLSATFTQETIETLANLFGPPERVHMVSAVHLRPEPQYWFHKAVSPSDKRTCVIEALRHAPRPFILYVTKREEIREWSALLRQEMGLRRIDCFDGGTGPADRKRIIDDWVKNRLDGIVATSAFGVGIDKGDVRTVIHATIPETLDRYYQEVGRGGRDGRPSVSLVVYDDSDWALPTRLAKPQIITEELGISRWKAMFQSRKPTAEDGLCEIDINAVRAGKTGGNDYNVNWNMRTLILMARAHLIELDVKAIAKGEEDENRSDEMLSLLAAMANIRIRIKNTGHLMPEVWEQAVTSSRTRTFQAAQRNLELMQVLLESKREVGETLAELYRVHHKQWLVPVTHVCGGCPSDRFEPSANRRYVMPTATTLSNTEVPDFAAWKARFSWIDPSLAYVFYDDERALDDVWQAIIKAVGWLVQECSVREVATTQQSRLLTLSEWRSLYRRASDGVVLHRPPNEARDEPYTPLARVTVLPPTTTMQELDEVQLLQRPYHVIFLPKSLPDPANDLRRFVDVCGNSIHLKQLLPVISQ